MRLLAIDSGFARIGFAVMEPQISTEDARRVDWLPVELGVIKTERSARKRGLRVADDNARRIAQASRSLYQLINTSGVTGMVAELPHTGAQNASAAIAMAYAAAIVVCAAEFCLMPIEYYTPFETRIAASGVSSAPKKDVMSKMVERYPRLMLACPTLSEREHVADALATFEAARTGAIVRSRELQLVNLGKSVGSR